MVFCASARKQATSAYRFGGAKRFRSSTSYRRTSAARSATRVGIEVGEVQRASSDGTKQREAFEVGENRARLRFGRILLELEQRRSTLSIGDVEKPVDRGAEFRRHLLVQPLPRCLFATRRRRADKALQRRSLRWRCTPPRRRARRGGRTCSCNAYAQHALHSVGAYARTLLRRPSDSMAAAKRAISGRWTQAC